MTGKQLIDYIKTRPSLGLLDVSATIGALLRENLISPSKIIDAQFDVLREEASRYRLHYNEGNVAMNMILRGDKKQLEWAKKRAMYNAMFDGSIPYRQLYADKLSSEDKEKLQKDFKMLYGFDPEE